MDHNKFYDDLHKNMIGKEDSYLEVDDSDIILEILNFLNLSENIRVLDLGCGSGFLKKKILDKLKPNMVTGLDISKEAITLARERFSNIFFICGDAEVLNSLNGKKFDLIVSADLFEHLGNQRLHLKSIKTIMERDGVYLLKTPNKVWDDLYYKKILLRKDYQKKHVWWLAHKNVRTSKFLKTMLKEEGFEYKFLRIKRLTEANRKKVRLIFGDPLSNIVIVVIHFLLFVLPINLSPYFIVLINFKNE